MPVLFIVAFFIKTTKTWYQLKSSEVIVMSSQLIWQMNSLLGLGRCRMWTKCECRHYVSREQFVCMVHPNFGN